MNEIDLMTEDRPKPRLSNPGVIEERPWWVMPVLLVWIGLVLAGYFAMTYAWADTTPAPSTPAPSPSSWSPECTAEDLEDGMCLTYDDIRELEWHTEGPTR